MATAMKRLIASALTLSIASSSLAEETTPRAVSAESRLAIARAIAPSLVTVEYHFQLDKGDSPYGWWHSSNSDFASLIDEERPMRVAGFLVGERTVVSQDLEVHPRFVAKIEVRHGTRVVTAKRQSVAEPARAVFLALDAPLEGTKPLEFAGDGGKGQLVLTHRLYEGVFGTRVTPNPGAVRVEDDGRVVAEAERDSLLLDSEGKPITAVFGSWLPLEGSLAESPTEWPRVAEDELAATVQRITAAAGRAMPHVTLKFRSPPAKAQQFNFMISGSRSSDEMTEWQGPGLLLDRERVLVLAALKPAVTARLESISVRQAGGAPIVAKFAGSLEDYGAFLVNLEQPLDGEVVLSEQPVLEWRDRLLVRYDLSILGESITTYVDHARLTEFSIALRGALHTHYYGSDRSRSRSTQDGASGRFFFDPAGPLVALPLPRRPRPSSEDRSWNYQNTSTFLPAHELASVIAAGASAIDPDNVPLSEDDENRLAWIGVEMQPLDADLARANDVADQTKNGSTGVLVTYVYPDSPASRSGIAVGDILLRVEVEGQPKPLDFTLNDSGGFPGFGDIFEMIDQLPAEFVDSMPKPWGSPKNAITTALTEHGFGTPFTLVAFQGGMVTRIPMQVEQGPAYFDSAKKHESKPTGITVRDATYEVRRYFQMQPTDPGVIISKIEKGSRAAIAGIKPFELILAIDEKPMANVAEVEKALVKDGELRIEIRRMLERRIVKLTPDPKAGDGE
jgi:serine protease Do